MLGRYAEALPVYAVVLTAREQTLGPLAHVTLEARSSVGWTLHMLDRNDEALPLAQHLVTVQTEVLGSEHRDSLDTHMLLGWILLGLGQKAGATSLAVRLHQGLLQRHGPADEPSPYWKPARQPAANTGAGDDSDLVPEGRC
jgi:hypothetical protein